MSGVNKAIILGRLTAKPESKFAPSGSAICNFSVATSEEWQDKTTGEKKEKAEFHRCVVYGKLAEVCNQYLDKGRQIYLEGRIQTRSWDDKDGKKCYMTEINVSTVQFIGSKASDRSEGENNSHQDDNTKDKDYKPETNERFTSDDIPF